MGRRFELCINRQPMDHDDSVLSWYLGIGGPQPGVARVCPGQSRADSLLGLPQGQSVYALDLSSAREHIAAGTRSGRIEIFGWPLEAGSMPQTRQSLEQGAPVLSVRFLSEGRLASTDAAGRCLLWRFEEDPCNPVALDTDGGIVCSPLELPDSRLLGLSSRGSLLLWSLRSGRLLRSVPCPMPPGKLALVRLLHWHRLNAIAYGAAGGRLVVCELDRMRLRICKAHARAFYAIFLVGGQLCTIGSNDGLLKAWPEITEHPAWQCQAPVGVVAAQEAGTCAGQILLATHGGRAAIHVIESNQIRLQQALAVDHCRTVVSALPQARAEVLQQRRVVAAQELCSKIEQSGAEGQQDKVDALHQQLVDMGYQSVSLALRARHAATRKDLLAELRARHSLVHMLPADDPLAEDSRRRYAQSLQDAWLLADALGVYSRIRNNLSSPWLEQTCRAMEADDWVVQTDQPLQLLVESASVVDRPFLGRWVLHVLDTVAFREGRLSAESLARKYRQVNDEEGRCGPPAAEVRPLRWLSGQMPETIDTILVAGAADPMTEGAELAVQVLHDGAQTVLVEHLLFRAGMPSNGQSPRDHNLRVIRALGHVSRNGSIQPWLGPVRQAMNQALRRLHTEAIYRRRAGKS